MNGMDEADELFARIEALDISDEDIDLAWELFKDGFSVNEVIEKVIGCSNE